MWNTDVWRHSAFGWLNADLEGAETCSARILVFRELGVEDDVGRWEVDSLDVGAGLSCAVFTIHSTIFPFYGEWALVFDVIQSANDLLKVDVAPADGLEVPVAVVLVEVDVATKYSSLLATTPSHVLHVNVENAVSELTDEAYVIDALVAEVTWIVVESERWVVSYR